MSCNQFSEFSEPLETRRLLSASLNATTGVLTCNGTGGNDQIILSVSGTNIKVQTNGASQLFAAAKVKSIVVNGLAGNDSLKVNNAITKPATMNGGDGVDYLQGGGGNDALFGGNGNDVLVGADGKDDFYGGAGTDTADYSMFSTGVNVSLDNVRNDGRGGEQDFVHMDVENITGSKAGDVLTGNAGANLIQGLSGTDTIYGLGGNDTLDGGRQGFSPAEDMGNDKVYGGDGNDALYASDFGNNTLDGGNGNDRLFSYAGNDTLYGGAGDDRLDSFTGDDRLYGGPGKDTFFAGAGDDFIDARDGAYTDVIDGGAGNDTADIDSLLIFLRDSTTNVEHVI